MEAARDIVRRYYLAMAVPFAIDFLTSTIYAAINAQFGVLAPMMAVSALFLIGGAWIGSFVLIDPARRFMAGNAAFADVEASIAGLPRRSAFLIGCLYAPMLALRLLSPRVGITFGTPIEVAAWIDTTVSFLVVTAFNIVLTQFVISAYVDRLSTYLFETRGVNIATFRGSFRRKVGLAVFFISFAATALFAGDILSYEGERLVREASADVIASVVAAATIYYWVTRAFTQPIDRLDKGMQRVAGDDLTTRLPVTSDDEMGRTTSEFNHMVEGLAEREYLRDTFGKYVSESVATAILGNREGDGRVTDRTGIATLMFTDIEGFTHLSEGVSPTDLASILNTYLGIVVPAIERHGGVVNNFIGDGLFASFNLPLPRKGHASAAVRAALDIQRALAHASFASGVSIRTRIGINTGPVIGLSIGTDKRLDYTLLGDAVNVASRIEQLNKRFGSLILATESTMRATGYSFPAERLGETGVRGHEGDVVVFRIETAP